MNDENKKYLGVEFYRNFVGIKSSLRVRILENSEYEEDNGNMDHKRVWSFRYISCSKSLLIGEDGYLFGIDYSDCKPYLRTIEDLSDEELLSVIKSAFPRNQITIKNRTESFIDFKILDSRAIECNLPVYFDFNDGLMFEFTEYIYTDEKSFNGFIFELEKISISLAEKHCHLKAKEYIDNGLALSIKDLK